MSQEFEFSIRAQGCEYIVLTAKGAASAEQIEQMYEAAFGFAESKRLFRVLVDLVAIDFAYPMAHFLPLMQRLSPYLSRFKTARLIGEDSFRHDLVETVSHKSCFALKNFDDKQQAVEWLLVD